MINIRDTFTFELKILKYKETFDQLTLRTDSITDPKKTNIFSSKESNQEC